MRTLHARYIKIVAAGGDLDAASEISLAKDVVVLKSSPNIVEHVCSDNPNPVERQEIGTGFEIRGVLAAATLDDLVFLVGGSHITNVYTKIQGIRTLPKYDIRLGIYRPADGLIILEDLTDMHFVGEIEQAFEQGNNTYIPFTAKATATSDLTIDNSA
jgi:hypothetical protein